MLRSIFLVFLFAIFANAKLTRRDLISEAIAKGKDADKKFADAVPNAEPKLLEDAETAPKETPKNLSPLLPKQSDPFLLGRRPSYHHHQHHHHVANQGQKCCNQDKVSKMYFFPSIILIPYVCSAFSKDVQQNIKGCGKAILCKCHIISITLFVRVSTNNILFPCNARHIFVDICLSRFIELFIT